MSLRIFLASAAAVGGAGVLYYATSGGNSSSSTAPTLHHKVIVDSASSSSNPVQKAVASVIGKSKVASVIGTIASFTPVGAAINAASKIDYDGRHNPTWIASNNYKVNVSAVLTNAANKHAVPGYLTAAALKAKFTPAVMAGAPKYDKHATLRVNLDKLELWAQGKAAQFAQLARTQKAEAERAAATAAKVRTQRQKLEADAAAAQASSGVKYTFADFERDNGLVGSAATGGFGDTTSRDELSLFKEELQRRATAAKAKSKADKLASDKALIHAAYKAALVRRNFTLSSLRNFTDTKEGADYFRYWQEGRWTLDKVKRTIDSRIRSMEEAILDHIRRNKDKWIKVERGMVGDIESMIRSDTWEIQSYKRKQAWLTAGQVNEVLNSFLSPSSVFWRNAMITYKNKGPFYASTLAAGNSS